MITVNETVNNVKHFKNVLMVIIVTGILTIAQEYTMIKRDVK